MKEYVYQKYLYIPFNVKTKKSTSMKNIKSGILDKKVVGTTWLCLMVPVAFNISKEITTKGLMLSLAKLYEKSSTSKKVFLMKHLFNMKL